jgi:SAM-dependent methyltransferase
MQGAITLRESVRNAYSAAADKPGEEHAFPVGRAFAESVGYPGELLDSLPACASDGFAGVSNVSVFAEVPSAATVLDLGCGAGLDALVAARRVGSRGKVIGVDFSDSMLERARRAADESGTCNVELRLADAEKIPLADASVDVVLINGILNLNPAREAILRELARVLRPGGAAWVAELILKEPLSEAVQANPTNWFA